MAGWGKEAADSFPETSGRSTCAKMSYDSINSTETSKRRASQLLSAQGKLFALCDDGTVWYWDNDSPREAERRWKKIADIPDQGE